MVVFLNEKFKNNKYWVFQTNTLTAFGEKFILSIYFKYCFGEKNLLYYDLWVSFGILVEH